MEQEQNNVAETAATTTPPVAAALKKELSISRFTRNFAASITREITVAEIILFAAAFATLPFVDLIAKSFGILGETTRVLYALIPAAAFALGYWFSRDGVRPLGIFLHSLAAIALIETTTALLPMIPGVQQAFTAPGAIAIGMPILTIVFLYAAAKVPHTGASYIFASIATIMIFFLSASELLAIPCNNALIGGSDKADMICRPTPYIQNTLIPIAIFILGYFSFPAKDEKKV